MSNILQKQLNSFHIELVSDINRTRIEVFCPEIFSFKVDTHSLQRVVYSEISESLEMTLKRVEELKKFTKTQKVKLIKNQNPNWRSIRFLNQNLRAI